MSVDSFGPGRQHGADLRVIRPEEVPGAANTTSGSPVAYLPFDESDGQSLRI